MRNLLKDKKIERIVVCGDNDNNDSHFEPDIKDDRVILLRPNEVGDFNDYQNETIWICVCDGWKF